MSVRTTQLKEVGACIKLGITNQQANQYKMAFHSLKAAIWP